MNERIKNIFSTKRAYVFVGILVVFCIGGIVLLSKRSQPGNLIPGDTNIPVVVDTSVTPTQGDTFGIDIQLSDGKPGAQTVEALPVATGEPLSPEDIQLIYARLPALTPAPNDQTEFNPPQELLPPPRPGNVIEGQFPPLETGPGPVESEAGPLQVSRYAPEGEIPIAPFVSVTFNQAMVPLGTLGDLAAKDVPVIIEPSLPGTWRWLGTKTLTFEYDSELIDRLPKATEYHVTVPAGTKSANGKTLAEAVTWTFKTPPPKMVNSFPGNSSQPLNPIMFIAFDQRIDPDTALKNIKVTAGSQSIDLVLATQAEIDEDERVNQLVKNAPEGRWLAFRAVNPFPAETNISVTVEAGMPSAEGPLTTTEAQSFSFSTYAPLRIEEHRCSWYDDRCPPLTPFVIRFNNSLDTSVYSDDMLQVEPELPGVSANVYGNTINIRGATSGQTTYTVTLSGRIQDIFGQQLGDDTRLTFKVGKADSVLVNTGQNFITLDPTASKKIFSVYAINYNKLNLKVYSVQPADWTRFKEYLRDWRQTDNPPAMPGVQVENKSLALDIPDDTLTQVDIDLGKYMSGDYGQFVVIVEPPKKIIETNEDKYRRFSQTIITLGADHTDRFGRLQRPKRNGSLGNQPQGWFAIGWRAHSSE